MRTIPIGATGTFTLAVPPEQLASRSKDAALPDDLATPVLVMVIANAALAALEPYLEPRETAVGTGVDLRHLAPVGMRLIGEASVTRVEGQRVEFRVSVADEFGQIGAGSHERLVVDAALMERVVEAKRSAARISAGSPVLVSSRGTA
jgi:fluoroacetyl-CoA thioesterase